MGQARNAKARHIGTGLTVIPGAGHLPALE
jgi:hypothetical protein